jgi:hypothetical protein
MTRIPVDGSSRIASWGYNSEANTLEVEFQGKTGSSVYEYQDVPEAVWQNLRQVPGGSPGKAFDALIKTGGYSYQRIA